MSQFSPEAYKAAETYLATQLRALGSEELANLLDSEDYQEARDQALRDMATKFQTSIDRLSVPEEALSPTGYTDFAYVGRSTKDGRQLWSLLRNSYPEADARETQAKRERLDKERETQKDKDRAHRANRLKAQKRARKRHR